MSISAVRFGSFNMGLIRKLCLGNNHINVAQFELALKVVIAYKVFLIQLVLNGDRYFLFLPKLPSCELGAVRGKGSCVTMLVKY
jgi:hypothetical protein